MSRNASGAWKGPAHSNALYFGKGSGLAMNLEPGFGLNSGGCDALTSVSTDFNQQSAELVCTQLVSCCKQQQ